MNRNWCNAPLIRPLIVAGLAVLVGGLLVSTACLRAAEPPAGGARVLWHYEAQEHFLCSPSLAPDSGDLVVAPGLGAFNTPFLVALRADPQAAQRVAWIKRSPFLRQPIVSPPAFAGGMIVFGDGMHQTDGATLRCLKLDGTPVWQLPVPGALVHMEGSPIIADGRVYIGGGNAGVLCVDLEKLVLEGKPTTRAEVEARNSALWAEMQRKYEEEKLKDPDFAIPPSETDLLKPEPARIWQIGHGQASQPQWHVDAQLALTGDNLVVASAFLDVEHMGDRALFCVDAASGKVRWRTGLTYNPWAGATPAGDLLLVGGSSIRFDPKEIPGAKGEVLVLKLSDGSQVWKKTVPGGVMCAVAAAGDVMVFTATDGRIRAWSKADGAERWVYNGGAPFFAGAVIENNIVYSADLKGVVHAVSLADGKLLWKVDLGAAPLSAPGMVYGTPAVRNGRVYVATSNLDAAPGEPAKTVVACVGEK
jgi:outer membrane protein assembly factor BamB